MADNHHHEHAHPDHAHSSSSSPNGTSTSNNILLIAQAFHGKHLFHPPLNHFGELILGTTSSSSSSTSSSSTSSTHPPIPLEHQVTQNASNSTILCITLIVCLLSALFSIVGNSLIIWLIARTRSFRHNPTFLFITSICVSDIAISTLVVPFQYQVNVLERWMLPWFLCAWLPTIQVIMVSNSVFTMTAIALERYWAVLYPLKAKLTRGQAKWEIMAIWLASVVICVPTWIEMKVSLTYDPYTGQQTMAHCHAGGRIRSSLYSQYQTALTIVHYFIPLCIISYAYLRMAIVLNGGSSSADDQTLFVNNSQSGRVSIDFYAKVQSKKRKVVKMLFFVVSLFMVCWLPIQLINLCTVMWPQIKHIPYFNVIKFACSWLAMSASSYNPYIYIIYNANIRTEFKRRFNIIYYLCCSTRKQWRSKSTSSGGFKANCQLAAVKQATRDGGHNKHGGQLSGQLAISVALPPQSNHKHHHQTQFKQMTTKLLTI